MACNVCVQMLVVEQHGANVLDPAALPMIAESSPAKMSKVQMKVLILGL